MKTCQKPLMAGYCGRGGRVVINANYNKNNIGTWTDVTVYDNTALADLPTYSLDGSDNTIKLEKLGIYFSEDAIVNGGIIPTETKYVKSNELGANGEWRNGALTIQAILVNDDGTVGFTTDTSYSNGGVQGVATSGLLYESTIFWHFKAN